MHSFVFGTLGLLLVMILWAVQGAAFALALTLSAALLVPFRLPDWVFWVLWVLGYVLGLAVMPLEERLWYWIFNKPNTEPERTRTDTDPEKNRKNSTPDSNDSTT